MRQDAGGEWRLINGRALYNLRDDPEQRRDLAAELPEVVGKFLRRLAADAEQSSAPPLAAGPGPDRLTPRELEVLKLIAAGLSNKEIAARLTVTVATVKTHLEHILQKMQVSDRTQAAVQAVTRGLLG